MKLKATSITQYQRTKVLGIKWCQLEEKSSLCTHSERSIFVAVPQPTRVLLTSDEHGQNPLKVWVSIIYFRAIWVYVEFTARQSHYNCSLVQKLLNRYQLVTLT